VYPASAQTSRTRRQAQWVFHNRGRAATQSWANAAVITTSRTSPVVSTAMCRLRPQPDPTSSLRRKMYGYLVPNATFGDLPPAGLKWDPQELPESAFSVNDVFCLIGTDPKDYGQPRVAVGPKSDGLVFIEHAYVRKAHRAFVYRSAARLTRSGRRRRLKISATWPWAPAIVTAWDRITALPQAP